MSINMRELASHILLAVLPFFLILPTVVEASSVEKSHLKNKKRLVTCDNYSRDKLLRKASKYQDLILKSSQNHRVSPHLITAIITVESCFRSRARSSAGAAGLMQLMPATAKRFGLTKHKQRYNSENNINAGTKYLRFLLNRFNGNVLLAAAAYNAGEGAVDKYNGVPPYKETQAYVRKVLNTYRKLAKVPVHRITRVTKASPAKKKYTARRANKLAKNTRSRAWYIKQYERLHLKRKLNLSAHEIKHATRLLRNEEMGKALSFKQFL
jgi:soluble lytic murein transglycosylase-like protein